MIAVLNGTNYDNAADFVKAVNAARLKNKKKWLRYVGLVNGKVVSIKTFDHSYLQIFKVDGINHAPPIDTTVTAWKDHILTTLS
jgi:hypothetical protein